ncbi:MAG: single-stranded DNA-binding protein [Ignavibacteriaceae bacterium]|nr:single-stranded DNA-binding protein [Ignavibacteriaceae bacterium]
MAFSLNRIMLIGNLGRDAETRFTADNNLAITNFSLATTYGYKGKSGDWVNETTWHRITGFNLSDFMKDNLKKGKKFYVEGRLTTREYTDKEGVKRYSTDVIAEKIIPLETSGGGAKDDETSNGSTESAAAPDVQDNNDLPF